VKTTTAVGAKIKQALIDYGGYFVDDTGSQRGGAAICMEPGVSTEVAKAYGPEQDFHIQTQVRAQQPTQFKLKRKPTHDNHLIKNKFKFTQRVQTLRFILHVHSIF